MKFLIRVKTLTEYETVVEAASLDVAIADAKLDGMLNLGKVVQQIAEVESLSGSESDEEDAQPGQPDRIN